MTHPFSRFFRNEAGALSVEAAIVFPLLLWALGAMYVFWDAYDARNTNLKATYTIADMVSRETNPIDATYVDGLNDVYEFLISRDDGNDLRITVVSVGLDDDGITPRLQLEWSHATGDKLPIDDITLIQDRLPIMSVGDQLIVVQSEMRWEPILNFGLSATDMSELVFTSPRFAPQVIFEEDDAGADPA